MKKSIHPTMHPTVFIDISSGDQILTTSTMQTSEKMDIDGVTYQVVRSDITSHSHPFFTGEMRFVDLKGRVDGFNKKMQHAAERQKKLQEKNAKKVKDIPTGPVKSYRDLLREQQSALRESNKATTAAE